MVGWMIFLSIVLLFVIFFSLSIVFRVQYDESLSICVGIGKFQYSLFPGKEKESTAKKKTKSDKKTLKKKKKNVPKEAQKKPEKGDIKETVSLVFDLLSSIMGPLRFLLKKVRITNLAVDIVVGAEDAAEVALLYGKTSALLYGGLAAIRHLMPIKIDRIHLVCDFLKTETSQKIFFKIKIRIGVVCKTAICMAVQLLVNTYKRSKNQLSEEKTNSHKDRAAATEDAARQK